MKPSFILYTFQIKIESRKYKKNQPVGNRKNFTQEIGSKPATLKSNNKSEFAIQFSNEKESKFLPTIKSSDKINQSKGLIYIHDYKIPDTDDYGIELKKEYNLSDVLIATWIKTKNTTSTSLLLTFKEKEPPR